MGHIPLLREKEYSDKQLIHLMGADLTYLRNELQIELGKIQRLEAEMNLLSGDPCVRGKRTSVKRTVFVDSVEEARQVRQDLVEKAAMD
ncbi:unnamed protein product [Protopolystoma xenopodis]|uniref:Uncharacterized protein n=1 Tax=Protopolystoma xenopodis TaxID=117903 RepID=A0A448WZZ2_9PLAT|nr:unnamed protein product [Protopolystoma xenopodis]